jgi:hypothetical protein
VNIKLLTDNIMRQTTVLIAQLSTAAGVRAPLAHIADQVFLTLAREIEAQGVGRKVVADMFGMALRGYQVKTQRLAESQSQQGKTLFEAVLEYLDAQGSVTRRALLQRFRNDGERETVGVLNDLIGSGLVHATGRGAATLYGVTTEADRQRLTRESDDQALGDMIWGAVYRAQGRTQAEVAVELQLPTQDLNAPLERLIADGRVQKDPTERLTARGFQIPTGAEHGWESAVFDHFQAVAVAISSKLAALSGPRDRQEILGGTTLRFELSKQHPHRARVLGLLQETRKQLNAVWGEVSVYNDAHPIAEDERFNVVFYFGQNVDRPDWAVTSPSTEASSEPSP